MANYGIIDCGSNTIRLCIYEVPNTRPRNGWKRKNFTVLLNHKIMAGLASYVQDDAFTNRGMKKAIDVINEQIARAAYFKCKRLDIFATAVIRNCTNSQQAIQTIEAGIGHSLTLLSAVDEAHLGFVGAQSGEKNPLNGTLIDIGGGSTELTGIADGRDFNNISLPQGSLSSFSQFVRGILPAGSEQQRIRENLRKLMISQSDFNDYRTSTVYGVGGSVRAIAKVFGEIFCDGTKPTTLTTDDLQRLLGFYRTMPAQFSHAALAAAPDRLHTIVPGCLIAHELLSDLGAEKLTICKGGVREGYLIECIL